MSLIFDYLAEYEGQPHEERELVRIVEHKDGIGELINSDGSSLLDTIKHCYEDYYNYKHPFYNLPNWYEEIQDIRATKFIYRTIEFLYEDYELKVRD